MRVICIIFGEDENIGMCGQKEIGVTITIGGYNKIVISLCHFFIMYNFCVIHAKVMNFNVSTEHCGYTIIL